MKRVKLITFIISVSFMFFNACPAFADWYFDIDETSHNVYDFRMIIDQAYKFDGGTGSFLFDNTETLDWTYTFSYPSPLMELFGSPWEGGENGEPGDIDNLTGAAFMNHPTLDPGTYVLATFTFTGTGDANFRFDMDDSTMKFELDDVIYSAVDYPEHYRSPSAVPVPAAIWLLGTGLIGLLGVKRNKQ